jgi:hypothetical protein
MMSSIVDYPRMLRYGGTCRWKGRMSGDEEDARWAIAYAMAHELAVEAGVTDEDLA